MLFNKMRNGAGPQQGCIAWQHQNVLFLGIVLKSHESNLSGISRASLNLLLYKLHSKILCMFLHLFGDPVAFVPYHDDCNVGLGFYE
jgi:hypothetical protein